MLACNEFDRLLLVEKSGGYKVIVLPPEKLFVGKLYDVRKYDSETEFGVIYRETKSGKYYGKRSSIGGFILDKEYALCPPGCKLELLTPRPDAVYQLSMVDGRGRSSSVELNLMELPERSPKARGILVSGKTVSKITHVRYLSEEELAAFHAGKKVEVPPEQNDGKVAENDPLLSEPAVKKEVVDRQKPEEREVSGPEAPSESAAPKAVEKKSPPEESGSAAPETVEEKSPPEEPGSAAPETVEKKSPSAEPEEVPPWDENAPAPSIDTPAAAVLRQASLTPEPPPPAENALVLDAEPESRPRRPRQRAERKPEPSRKPVPPKTEDDEDENFGIVQPEFGF